VLGPATENALQIYIHISKQQTMGIANDSRLSSGAISRKNPSGLLNHKENK